ncbi:hypothetical protein CYMTET_34627, partial [Cymbomonas tetramitiformis]
LYNREATWRMTDEQGNAAVPLRPQNPTQTKTQASSAIAATARPSALQSASAAAAAGKHSTSVVVHAVKPEPSTEGPGRPLPSTAKSGVEVPAKGAQNTCSNVAASELATAVPGTEDHPTPASGTLVSSSAESANGECTMPPSSSIGSNQGSDGVSDEENPKEELEVESTGSDTEGMLHYIKVLHPCWPFPPS